MTSGVSEGAWGLCIDGLLSSFLVQVFAHSQGAPRPARSDAPNERGNLSRACFPVAVPCARRRLAGAECFGRRRE